MVIIMGSRMEKHRKKDKRRIKKRKKLKFIIIFFLIISFILVLTILDTELRASTDSQEEKIYGLSVKGDFLDIELLGNKYHIDKRQIEKIFKTRPE